MCGPVVLRLFHGKDVSSEVRIRLSGWHWGQLRRGHSQVFKPRRGCFPGQVTVAGCSGVRCAHRVWATRAHLNANSSQMAVVGGISGFVGLLLVSKRSTILVSVLIGLMLLGMYEEIFGRFLPNQNGRLGHDYAYFLPRLLAGKYYWTMNGVSIPWFSPFACGGLPSFPNPQDQWFSFPQLLSLVVSPLASIHLTLLMFAGIGFFGCYLLLLISFGCPFPVAMTGATIFLFNGFFGARMAIGHLTAHGFMLVPMVAYLLICPEAAMCSRVLRVVGAGLLGAYLLLTAAQFIPPFMFALLAVCLIYVLGTGRRWHVYLHFALVVIIAIMIASAKLVAAMSTLQQFPRSHNLVPGSPTLLGLLEIAGRGIFGFPEVSRTAEILTNQQWRLDIHELDYGLSIAPLFLAGIILWFAFPWRGKSEISLPVAASTPLLEKILLAILLVVPLALNFYSPGWSAALKHVPVLNSTSTYMRWFSIYVPIIPVAVSVALARVPLSVTQQWFIWCSATVVVLCQCAFADVSYYETQDYSPGRVLQGDAQLRRNGSVPPVERVIRFDHDSLVNGASTTHCYEALFGYRLENFPRGSLHTGPSLRADGIPNVKNPACYVYPHENGCVPGDHFRVDQADLAAAFLRYEPFEFQISTMQRWANMTSLLSLGGCCLAMLWAVLGLLRRINARPGPEDPI